MAPPPLLDLLDWRVPEVEVLAMICVSRVYACDALFEGLRAPPLTGWPSPAAIANGATQTAMTIALAMTHRRRDMKGNSLVVDVGLLPCNRPTPHSSRSYVKRKTWRRSVLEARHGLGALAHEREEQVQPGDLERPPDARVDVDDDE